MKLNFWKHLIFWKQINKKKCILQTYFLHGNIRCKYVDIFYSGCMEIKDILRNYMFSIN